MEPKLPTDADTNRLFDEVVEEPQARFEYSADAAATLAREYYLGIEEDPDPTKFVEWRADG